MFCSTEEMKFYVKNTLNYQRLREYINRIVCLLIYLNENVNLPILLLYSCANKMDA